MRSVYKVHLGGYVVILLLLIFTLAGCGKPTLPSEVDPFPNQTDEQFFQWNDSILNWQQKMIDSLTIQVAQGEVTINELSNELNGEWGSFNQN